MEFGKQRWIFPDAECPPEGVNSILGHESIIILNTGDQDAHVIVKFFYTDRPPVIAAKITVGAERVRCIKTNEQQIFGENTAVVGEQYAIMIESDIPVVAQYGRAETREVAFYTTPGYACGI